MKPVTSITRAVSLLEKMYRYFNEHCFDGRLHNCTITVEKMRGAFGCYWIHPQYLIKGDTAHYKIALNVQHLTKPVEFVAAVLLHEMCHHAAAVDGVQDCSNHGVYHNVKFKAYAEGTGFLTCERCSVYGWTDTNPNDAMLMLCADQDWPEFQIAELYPLIPLDTPAESGKPDKPAAPAKPRQSSIKHVCPKCGLIARTTKQALIVCGNCRVDMIPQ